MRSQIYASLLLGLSTLTAAIYKDEVGDIDFHHKLVGIPQSDTTFFHRPRPDDKASLLYTLSDVGVIGAINPSNGQVVWRQHISDDVTESAGFLRAPEGQNWLVAAHGRRVTAWDAMTGRSVWHTEFEGEARDIETIELTEGARKDVLALFDEDGTTVLRRLNGDKGTVVWEFRETSKDVALQVSNNIASIFVISLHGSPSSYSIKTTSLNPATGLQVDQWTVGAKNEVHDAKDVMFVGANSAAPVVAWTNADKTKLNVQVLGSKSKQEFALPADTTEVHVHAPHQLQTSPHFLVHAVTKTGNKAEVFHVELKKNQITKAYELPHLAGHGAFSVSSDNANVYFTRISEDEVTIVSSESHGILAKWPLAVKGGLKSVSSASEVIPKPGGKEFAVRSAVVTQDEDWVLIRNGQSDWTRHEGLTGAVAAVWAELPEAENLAKVLAEEAHTNPISAYIHRVNRHLADLKHLPEYLIALPGNIINSIISPDSGNTGALIPDSFGFNKIIVVVTRRGRFYGLSTGNHGKIVWSQHVLPQADGENLVVKGLTVQDEEGLVLMRGSKGESVLISSTDGRIIHAQATGKPIASVATITEDSRTWLLALGPDGLPADEQLGGSLSDDTIIIRDDQTIKGIKLVQNGKKIEKREIWQVKALFGQEIIEVATPPAFQPIASIGRVLGDRRVSYKYLNPNTAVVVLAEKASSIVTIQLIDTVSGQLLVSQRYTGVDLDKEISCTIIENWYACSFFGDYLLDDGSNQSIKGYQVVSTDLYESPNPNDRGPLEDDDKASSLEPVDHPTQPPLPHAISQSFVMSQPLGQLASTQTRQGISSKNLLAYLPEANSILSLPRLWIDPRRAIGRDPSAAEMEAEGLPRYSPAIELDSRAFVSHEREVIGVIGFASTPAVVESTSLFVAFGIDIFGTRIVPSGPFDTLGKGFSKLTVTATVIALFIGVVCLGPMVRSKQIKRTWEAFI